MNDKDLLIEVKLNVTPLNNINVEWNIPIKLLNNGEFSISLLTYKYVLSEILKVPIPLSYKSIKLDTELYSCELINNEKNLNRNFDGKIEEDFKENRFLRINLKNIDDITGFDLVRIRYTIKEIVNTDGIFFKIVFPIINMNKNELKIKLLLDAHFSYGIRKFKFYVMNFDSVNGITTNIKSRFYIQKKGDMINVRSKLITLFANDEMDLHLQATRLPFLIKKDYFWILIFVIVVFLLLLPIINFVMSLFNEVAN